MDIMNQNPLFLEDLIRKTLNEAAQQIDPPAVTKAWDNFNIRLQGKQKLFDKTPTVNKVKSRQLSWIQWPVVAALFVGMVAGGSLNAAFPLFDPVANVIKVTMDSKPVKQVTPPDNPVVDSKQMGLQMESSPTSKQPGEKETVFDVNDKPVPAEKKNPTTGQESVNKTGETTKNNKGTSQRGNVTEVSKKVQTPQTPKEESPAASAGLPGQEAQSGETQDKAQPAEKSVTTTFEPFSVKNPSLLSFEAPAELPLGLKLIKTRFSKNSDGNNNLGIYYQNSEKQYLTIFQKTKPLPPPDGLKDVSPKQVTFNGISGSSYSDNSEVVLQFNIKDMFFEIRSNLTEDEVLQILNSVPFFTK